MYGWLWHHLPGGTAARAGTMTVLGIAITTILWFYAFPWAATHLPIDSSSFGG